MTSAYDRLKRLQNLRGQKAPRFLATPAGVPTTTIPASLTSPAPGTTITPTNSETFVISKDGGVDRWSGTFYPSGNPRVGVAPPAVAPYPPTGTIRYLELYGTDPTWAGPAGWRIEKTYQETSGEATYVVGVGLLAFDTSALPDDALITGATLRLYAVRILNTDSRSISFEWAAWTGTWGLEADYTPLVGTSAHTGVPLSTFDPLTYSLTEIPLQNAATGVSKTGTTYLKAGITGGAAATGVAGEWSGGSAGWAGKGYTAQYGSEFDKSPRLIVHYA